MVNFLNAGIFLLVADEEGTIEEQEMMEGEADHKTELADLAKDGDYFLYFWIYFCLDWERLFSNSMLMLEFREPLIFVGRNVILISERRKNRYYCIDLITFWLRGCGDLRKISTTYHLVMLDMIFAFFFNLLECITLQHNDDVCSLLFCF